MTYVLCDFERCAHHDGDGCTLENAELKDGVCSEVDLFMQFNNFEDGYNQAVRDIANAIRRFIPIAENKMHLAGCIHQELLRLYK